MRLLQRPCLKSLVAAALLALAGCVAREPSLAEQKLQTILAPSSTSTASLGPTPRARPAEHAAQGDRAAAADTDPGLRAQYFMGTGEAVAKARPATTGAVSEATGDITLNFLNADLREVVRSVLSDILKLPYAIDPKAQGTVTLQTARPVDRDSLLPILETALHLNGLSLVRATDLYTVVPTADAQRYAPIGHGPLGATTQGYAIQAIPLRFTAADEMHAILKSVLPAETVLRTVPARNLLIVAGSQRELAGVREMVALFDVNWLAGMSYALFYPRNVQATALVAELEAVFGAGKGGGLIRFTPIERLNAVLAMTRTPTFLREAAGWAERLDQATEAVDERIYVYYVQNGRATNLAASLNGLFGRKPDARPSTANGSAARRATPDAASDPPPPTPPLALVPPAAPGLPSMPGLPGSQPPQAAPDASAAPERPAAPPAAGGEGIRLAGRPAPKIIADEDNNALLILATPREYRVVRDALTRLDLAPLQVLIEAVVAEVTLTNDLRHGVQWFFRLGSTSLTLSSAATGAVQPNFPGFSSVTTSGADIRAVLSALESVTEVKVLSSPQLMVLNNQTARLQVGDQVPIATQSASSVITPGAPIVNTIQYRDTGVILTVTPRVNEGGLVLMDIGQQVSDVAQTRTSGIDSPTIQQRKIDSSVSVQNGETIALGGLIRDRRSVDDVGVPLLKDLPVLGALFKATTDVATRTELVVLITPHVVRSSADIGRVTDEFRERLRAMSLTSPP